MTHTHEHVKSGDFRDPRLHEVMFVGGILCSQKMRVWSLPHAIPVHIGGFSPPIELTYLLRWICREDASDCRVPIYVDSATEAAKPGWSEGPRVAHYVVDYARPSRYWDEAVY